jgi:hypothetical protein
MDARRLERDQFQVHTKLQVELYILMLTFLESRPDARIAAWEHAPPGFINAVKAAFMCYCCFPMF